MQLFTEKYASNYVRRTKEQGGTDVKYENIVRCRFSTKKEQTMHFHQDIEIVYVLDGSLQVDYEDASYFLKTDDFLLINSNVRHEYSSEEEVLFGSVFIDYTMLTEIFGGEQLFFWCNSAAEKSESYEKMRYYIRQIFNQYQATEGQAIALKNSIYYQLIYLITSDFIVKKGMQQYDSLRGIQDERMNEIMSYIMTRYNEPITLQELADRLYLSHAYLSKYIKKNFGMSFLKLLNNIRLEHAVSELIYSNKPILKVAMDNGFANLASFNQVFKESYHLTPAEYRLEMQKKSETSGSSQEVENSDEVMEKVDQYLTSNLVSTTDAADSVVSVLEVESGQREKTVRYWQKMINIGPIENLLRYDVREQLKYLKETLGFEYVRFWQIYSERMMIQIGEQNTKHNFTLMDQVLDFLREIKVKPHIELGFKGHTFFTKVDHSMLSMNRQNPILQMEKNKGFLEDLARHLTRRYGKDEVEEWYIEIEKNSVLQETLGLDKYFEVFDTVAGIFKSYAPGIKVGGAGFSLNMMGSEFPTVIEKWKKRKYQPDFISLYSYPYIRDDELLEAGRNAYSSDESYLYHQITDARKVMNRHGMEETELLVTEWSSTLSNRNCLNDGCYKSAYMLKNYIENYGKTDALGYWVATDIFSEGIDCDDFLFGGCGLISRSGVCKPAYFAIEFMNHLESYMLGKNKNAIITQRENGVFFVCCHNYKHLNFRYFSRNENEIELENQQRFYTDNESMQMSFRIRNVNDGKYIVKIFSVSQTNGNAQHEWMNLGCFNDLSVPEVEYLKSVCQPKLSIFSVEATDHVLTVETKLTAQEIQGIVIAEL